MRKEKISSAVIRRLPRYYRHLNDLYRAGTVRISSSALAKSMGLTASQIRQDLSCFGGFGQQGYGYNVDYLYHEIGHILGLDEEHQLVIIGAGNLGQALANYVNFEKRGFLVKGVFDVNEDLVGRQLRGLEIMHIDRLESFMKEHKIDIAVLTVPKDGAIETAKRLADCGVKAILNFAHVDLNVPEGVQVENVHLSDSLMKLSYNIHRYENGHGS